MKEKISIRNICKLLEIQVVAHLRNAWLIIKSYYIDVNPFPQPKSNTRIPLFNGTSCISSSSIFILLEPIMFSLTSALSYLFNERYFSGKSLDTSATRLCHSLGTRRTT